MQHPSQPPLGVLRRDVQFIDESDACLLLAGFSRLRRPGALMMAFLDDDRRLVDVVTVDGGSRDPRTLVERLCSVAGDEVDAVFIAVDRTGEIPADRPHDELLWMELVELASLQDVLLLDWFVVFGTKCYSVAEFAPIPAQW